MTRPTFDVHLDAAQRETLRRSAARRPVSGGVPAPDVDVDAVIGRQLTSAQLRELTPHEVNAAHAEGRLLGIMTPELAPAFTPPAASSAPGPDQLGHAQLAGMAPHDIEAARQSGRLEHMLSGEGEQ